MCYDRDDVALRLEERGASRHLSAPAEAYELDNKQGGHSMKMGRYCKAYPIKRLREFSGWTENQQNLRTEKVTVDGKEVEAPRTITDEDFLYLQENFVVTDGIFIDENVIFDNVTPEWQEFCKSSLDFQVPEQSTVA